MFEWKKVWADKKKYIKKKLSENLRMKNATGGGPYKAYDFSATEEAVIRICQFNESIQGSAEASRFGLPACQRGGEAVPCSSGIITNADTSATEDLCTDIIVEECFDDSNNIDLIESARPNASRKRTRQTQDLLDESNVLQKKFITELKTVMTDLVTCTKRTYRAVEKLAEQQKLTLQETKRHNLETEKLRQYELERKLDLKKQLIDIKRKKMQMHINAD